MKTKKTSIIGLVIVLLCIVGIFGIWQFNKKTASEPPINPQNKKILKAGKDNAVSSGLDIKAKKVLSKKTRPSTNVDEDDFFEEKRQKPPLDDDVMAQMKEKEEERVEERPPTQARFFNLKMGKAFKYDPEKGKLGEIAYELEEPARVSIRVMARGVRELFLRTITDWEFQEQGPHVVTWDGRDSSGNILDPEKIVIRTRAEPVRTYNPGTMPLEDLSVEELVYGHLYGHDHNEHHDYACKDMKPKIENIVTNEIVSGQKVIKVHADEERRGYGDNYGYGVRYYVDYQLVHEEFYKPDCNGGFGYELDTTAYEDGEHILSVGTCDHNDHVGSATIKVVFDN